MPYHSTVRDSFVKRKGSTNQLEGVLSLVPLAVIAISLGLLSLRISPPVRPQFTSWPVPWGQPYQNAATGHQTPDTKTGDTQGAMTRPGGRHGDADTIYDEGERLTKSLRACVLQLCAESCQIRSCVQGGQAIGSRYEQSVNLQEIVTPINA